MLMNGDHFSDFINHCVAVSNERSSQQRYRPLGRANTRSHWSEPDEPHLPCLFAWLLAASVLWPWLGFYQILGILSSGFCSEFFSRLHVLIKPYLILSRGLPKGSKLKQKLLLCNCNLQLSNEKWRNALEINSNVASAVNQKCRQCFES